MKRITTGGRKGEIQKLVHVERVNGQWRSTLEKIKEKGEWWGSLITRGAPGVFVDKDGGGGGDLYANGRPSAMRRQRKKSFPLSVRSPFPSDARIIHSFSLSLPCTKVKKKKGRGEGIMYRNQMINY